MPFRDRSMESQIAARAATQSRPDQSRCRALRSSAAISQAAKEAILKSGHSMAVGVAFHEFRSSLSPGNPAASLEMPSPYPYMPVHAGQWQTSVSQPRFLGCPQACKNTSEASTSSSPSPLPGPSRTRSALSMTHRLSWPLSASRPPCSTASIPRKKSATRPRPSPRRSPKSAPCSR